MCTNAGTRPQPVVATAIGAQPDQPAAPPQTLDTITVKASLNRTSLLDMPLHTTIITREDIEESPARTLDQLLRTIPGFDFTGVPAAISDPTGQQTKMRGLGNAKVLVLLDGVPIMDPFYLTTQFYKVSLADVEHIEVVRGGTSSLWGSMAVAGMVNIITRRPHDDAGELTVGTGNRGTASVAWSQDLKVSDALALNLAADQYRTEGYVETPAPYRWKFPSLHATSARDTNVELAAYFQPAAHLHGFVRVGAHRQDQDIGYAHGRNLQNNPDIALGLDHELDAHGSLALRAWAQAVHFTKFNGATCYYQPSGTCLNSNAKNQLVSNDVLQYYTQYGDLHYRERGAALTYSKFVNRWLDSFQVGVNYRRLAATDPEQFYATPNDPNTPQLLNATGYGQGQQTFAGAFAQVKLLPLPALQLTFSGRYDYWRDADQVNALTKTSTGVVAGGGVPASAKHAIDPSVGVHYTIHRDWSLRAAAYKAFRAPGFNNIARSYGVGPTTVANPNLGPETMTGWEAGSDYRNGAITLGATYFAYAIRNMIATYRINRATNAPQQVLNLCSTSATRPNLANCGGSANFYTNDQNGRSRGVELGARWDVAYALTLGAHFTYTDTYLTRKAAAITTPLDVQLVGVPKRTASVDATWQPTDRITAYAQAYYVGPMYLDETTTPGVHYGQSGSIVFNASVGYAVNDSLELSARLQNAFDKQYSENAYAITQPWKRTLSLPRTFFVSATLKY